MHIKDILNGAKLITLPATRDTRGTFIKAFHESTLAEHGIYFTLRESYFSLSKKDVIRGMHFQLPPWQHSKIVFCPQGSAFLMCLWTSAKHSPTYKQYFTHELSAENHKACYIPEGFAHGFKSLTDDALTYYLVSSEYNKEHDAGIRYDSIGLDWDVTQPILSARDLSFVGMEEFESPF